MEFVGMFAMGLFVGSVEVLGFKTVQNDFVKTSAAILSAVFGGVVLTFLKDLDRENKESIYMYPVGLLIALPWFHIKEMIAEPQPILQWGSIAGTVIATIFAIVLSLSSKARSWVTR